MKSFIKNMLSLLNYKVSENKKASKNMEAVKYFLVRISTQFFFVRIVDFVF